MKSVNLRRVFLAAVVICLALPLSAFAADKLIVKGTDGTTTVHVVQDTGYTGIGLAAPQAALHVENTNRPQFIVSNSAGNARMDFLRSSSAGVSQLLFGSGVAPTQTLEYQIGSFLDTNFQIRVVNQPGKGITITSAGNVGVATTSPTHLFQVNTAYNDGGAWVSGSSREYKKNIADLTSQEAMEAFAGLNPVKYEYKIGEGAKHVGFIAEDVPDLVATKDRKGLSALDIVAVLTKVVQEQQKTIAALNEKVSELNREVKLKNGFAAADLK